MMGIKSFSTAAAFALACMTSLSALTTNAAADAQLHQWVSKSFTCTATQCVCNFPQYQGTGGNTYTVVTNVSMAGEMSSSTIVKQPFISFPFSDDQLDGAQKKYYLSQFRIMSFGANYANASVTLNDTLQAVFYDPPVTVGFTYTGTKPEKNSFTCMMSGNIRNGLTIP